MRHGAAGRSTAAIQRQILSGRDAIHSLRSGNRLHVSLGGRLPGVHPTQLRHLLEHVQFHLDFDDWVYLRAPERRARLEKIGVAPAGDSDLKSDFSSAETVPVSSLRGLARPPNSFSP